MINARMVLVMPPFRLRARRKRRRRRRRRNESVLRGDEASRVSFVRADAARSENVASAAADAEARELPTATPHALSGALPALCSAAEVVILDSESRKHAPRAEM